MERTAIFDFCRYKWKTGFVRVIVYKLLNGQAAKAKKRKTGKAAKNQHQIQTDTKMMRSIHPFYQDC